jgi:hypothetical protein
LCVTIDVRVHDLTLCVFLSDPAVFIHKTGSLGDKIEAECGKNLTLSCMFRKNTFAIVWKNPDDISPIAQCIQNDCNLNPSFVGLYDIAFDKTRCVFNLTIIKATKKDNGRKLVCSDGSHSDFQILRVRG